MQQTNSEIDRAFLPTTKTSTKRHRLCLTTDVYNLIYVYSIVRLNSLRPEFWISNITATLNYLVSTAIHFLSIRVKENTAL